MRKPKQSAVRSVSTPNSTRRATVAGMGAAIAAVILPFLTEIGSRVHAAMANCCFGVIPPKAMFGRS